MNAKQLINAVTGGPLYRSTDPADVWLTYQDLLVVEAPPVTLQLTEPGEEITDLGVLEPPPGQGFSGAEAPWPDEWPEPVPVDAAEAEDVWRMFKGAWSTDETRQNINWLHRDAGSETHEPQCGCLVATDGHRLVYADEWALPAWLTPGWWHPQAIDLARTKGADVRLAVFSRDGVEHCAATGHLADGRAFRALWTIEGETYPNWRPIVGGEPACRIVGVDVAPLVKACKFVASKWSTNSNGYVSLERAGDDKLLVRGRYKSQQWADVAEVDARAIDDWPEGGVAFDPKYVIDAIGHVGGGPLTIQTTDYLSPTRWLGALDGVTAIVMPKRKD